MIKVINVKIKSRYKYLFRFSLLQVVLTYVTIFYFDNFLIGKYQNGLIIISNNLIDDRNRFYDFIPLSFIKIDIYLAIFIFIFLISLYSTKFYSYVNELTFTLDKSLFDEFFPIYLIWSASLLSFLQIFRFTEVARGYLVLFTFIVPMVLLIFRNSELISTMLGRNVSDENYISFNLDENSLFNELRILKFRKKLLNLSFLLDDNLILLKQEIEELNKKTNINLIVINLDTTKLITNSFEKYLLDLNKKVLLISKNQLSFVNNFYFRYSKVSNSHIYYINNDVQYGSRYILKRLLDIAVSLIALLLLLPLIFIITIQILTVDGKPIINKQTRVGLHGKNFFMYKFRTMKNNSHSERQKLENLNNKTGPLFKLKNDPRLISKLAWLRKYSLDEIPQFINVLKGDMSVVGPRPLFPEDNTHYDQIFIRRLNVLPGITGLLQINERNTDDFNIWYKYDIEYIDNWNLYLDIKIIFKTPFSILFKKSTGL